jgi:histidinol-phosphate aminotransferase
VFDIKALFRSNVLDMEEYTPIVPLEVLSARLGFPPEQLVKLDANENPYGPSPRALRAMCDFPYTHIYPDPGQHLLCAALEKYIGLDRSFILCGTGSDELLDLVLRLFIEPGDAILNCPPTFGMYSFSAGVCGAQVINVPRRDDFSLDVEAVESRIADSVSATVAGGDGTAHGRLKVLFISQPNNPDGGLVAKSVIERLLRWPVVVVMDEAYAEFSGETVAEWVPRYPNLIVMRTFSKWAGLAGLRFGYGLFPPDIIAQLWKIKQPYNVNVAAQAAVLASLEDMDYLGSNVRRIVAERERLSGLLQAVPYLRPYPSHSNFILCRVSGRDACDLKLALEKRGVLVRYFRKPGLTDCIRVSVGSPEQTDKLMHVLRSL